MAHITAVSNKLAVKLELGIYADAPYNMARKFIIIKNNVEEVYIDRNNGVTIVTNGRNATTLHLSVELKPQINGNTPYLIVDSVNGTVPLDTDNLMQLIFDIFN